MAAVWALMQSFVLIRLLGPRGRLFGPNLWCTEPQPRVALTFDDGPDPRDTPAILDILRETGVRATFFFVGERARAYPELVRRAAREGHECGLHSDTHPWWFSLAGPRRTHREVRRVLDTLRDLSGTMPRHYRPPMGHKNVFLSDEVTDAGLEMVTWSVRAFDTRGRSPERIRETLVGRVRPGGIVLLHEGVRRDREGQSPTVRALRGVIAGLRARDLEPVSLEDLRAPLPAPRPGAASTIPEAPTSGRA